MQRNWIGRSEGVYMEFDIEGSSEALGIYTTRPDTVMGVTYVAVAAEHPLARRQAEHDLEVAAFVDECRQGGISEAEIETMEKIGGSRLRIQTLLIAEILSVLVTGAILAGILCALTGWFATAVTRLLVSLS